jgi:hypothetical protein
VIFAEHDIETILSEVGSVSGQHRGFGVQCLALQDPAGMSPPTAFRWGMRIADMVAVLVMDTVGSYPEHRSAFQRGCGAGRHGIFQPLGNLVAAMRQQAVVAHADAHVDRQYIGNDEDGQRTPAEEEERGDRADMKDGQENGGCPGHTVVLRGSSQDWKSRLGSGNRRRSVDRHSNWSPDKRGFSGLDGWGGNRGSLDGRIQNRSQRNTSGDEMESCVDLRLAARRCGQCKTFVIAPLSAALSPRRNQVEPHLALAGAVEMCLYVVTCGWAQSESAASRAGTWPAFSSSRTWRRLNRYEGLLGEIDTHGMRNDAALVSHFQQAANGRLSILAIIQSPLVHVHADKAVG